MALMPSPNSPLTGPLPLSKEKLRNIIALLSAYALCLYGLETLIPSPIPWLRLGLANIITLITISLYGFRAAMMVTLIRIFVGSIFRGTFLGPAFILSLGGGVFSTIVMGITWRFLGCFGPVGISLIGSYAHNLAQLFLAYILFIRRIEAVALIAPIILLLGTVTGTFNGMVCGILLRNLKSLGSSISFQGKAP